MADFAVRVVRINQPVENHPNADRLSIVRVGGYLCISGKLEDGSHRYSEGDYVLYIPEGAVLPEWLLKHMDFWKVDPETGEGKGILAGSQGNRVKALKLRDIVSQGVLMPVHFGHSLHACAYEIETEETVRVRERMLELKGPGYEFMAHRHVIAAGSLSDCPDPDGWTTDEDGRSIADILGITKYEPQIPAHMNGEVLNLFGITHKYDFESIQTVTDLFEAGEDVAATEKTHGTFCQIGYVPGLGNPECFDNGDIYVCSKGLGNSGLAFKNNDANAKNLYVRNLRALLDAGLAERLAELSVMDGGDAKPIRIFGEIFGPGVQDLHYGRKEPTFQSFDIKVGDRFLPPLEFDMATKMLMIEPVPTLYIGPFDLDALAKVRDGKDTLSSTHVREGIVIRSSTGAYHPNHGRKIGKWISPAYLLRKAKDATEFQ